jgi:hypothetical protein
VSLISALSFDLRNFLESNYQLRSQEIAPSCSRESYSQFSKDRSTPNCNRPKLTNKTVPHQLFSGGAVFCSKSAIHSLILLALCPHCLATNIGT